MTKIVSQKDRLLETLFNHEGRTHVDLKFFRGSGNDIDPDELCSAVADSIFKINAGMVDPENSFGDADRKQTEVAKIIAAA